MKKTILFFAILFSEILISLAQPNGGFENWTPEFSYENPDGWATSNFLALTTPPNPISTFKATGVDRHSGNSALKIKTIFISNNPSPGMIEDTVGLVFTGKINISPPSYKYGFPYVARPEKLEFWYKYIPIGNDKGGARVILKKWNGSGSDTIALGEMTISTAITYTLFQIDLIYYSPEVPDSAAIIFSSSEDINNARVGSALYVDDVALTGWVRVEDQDIYTDKVKIFPNPASEVIIINAKIKEADNLQIQDGSGKIIGTYKIENYIANINTGFFAAGIYFYEIRDTQNIPLTKGKFNVIK